jgi:hypothetical protein
LTDLPSTAESLPSTAGTVSPKGRNPPLRNVQIALKSIAILVLLLASAVIGLYVDAIALLDPLILD